MTLEIAATEPNRPHLRMSAPTETYTARFFVDTSSTPDYASLSRRYKELATLADAAQVFARASERSGRAVTINPQYGCLPMIIGNDGKPVLMYEFVEVLHELVSLFDIRRELPTLSYAQIEGGMTFLRSLAQFNVKGVDIDREEEEMFEATPEFQRAIKDALELEETRVLSID